MDFLKKESKKEGLRARMWDFRFYFLALFFVILLFFLFSFFEKEKQPEKMSLALSDTWTNLGRVDDLVYFLENDQLYCLDREGTRKFALTLQAGKKQILYGDKIYVLYPNKELFLFDKDSGEILEKKEAKDLFSMAWVDKKLTLFYKNRIVYKKDPQKDLSIASTNLPLYFTYNKGSFAWIGEEEKSNLEEKGRVEWDPMIQKEIAGRGKKRMVWFSKSEDQEFSIVSGNQEFLSTFSLEDSFILETSSSYSFFKDNHLIKNVNKLGSLEACVDDSSFYLLYDDRLQIFDSEGLLLKEYKLEFEGKRILYDGEKVYIIGENHVAYFHQGKLLMDKMAQIMDVLVQWDQSIDLVYKDGIERLVR